VSKEGLGGPFATMAGTMQHFAVLLVLVSSCICLHIAADSTVQNASDQPVEVNGRVLLVGQIRTIEIESGKSTGSVDLTHVRNVTGVQVRNGREYFVIDNQNATGFLYGRQVRTLDLVEGRKVENSF